jgi:3-hydroxyisobutyrate dehydrogenase
MRDDRPAIGFVGLGAMGWPMAHNLHAAGFPLVVRDASAQTEDRFAAEHEKAMRARTPNDFRPVAILLTMLPDGAIVRDAVLGWGIAAVASPGTIVVDMSSSDPTDTLALASGLESFGVKVVDAPVSGGVARAVTGELAIMVGGAPQDIAAVQPVLRVLGDPARQFRTGELGTGHAMKALNNVIAAATSCVIAEALAAGRRFGLDAGTMIGVINASTGRSFVSELNYGTEVLTGRYGSGFRLGLMAKDTRIAASIAAAAGIDAPVIALASERWAAAVAELGPAVDQSRAHQAWRDAKLARELWHYRRRDRTGRAGRAG